MGIKSTYTITREVTLQVIFSKLSSASNEELADILENFKESYYRNYQVVDDESELDEDRTIESIEDFNRGY